MEMGFKFSCEWGLILLITFVPRETLITGGKCLLQSVRFLMRPLVYLIFAFPFFNNKFNLLAPYWLSASSRVCT